MSLAEKELNSSSKHPKRIDIWRIPEMVEVLECFDTKDIRELAVEGLERAPLQFWTMPASISKLFHHASEHEVGELEYNDSTGLYQVKKIGGKAYHTVRVVHYAEAMMEADQPAVTNFRGQVVATKPGNQFNPRERDLIRTACLWHDIFAGGTESDSYSKRRRTDPYHSHYHATEYAFLADLIPQDEWELLIEMISQHMWKWDKFVEVVKFHDMKRCSSVEEAYEFMRKYRMIRVVELSDLLASKNL